MEKSNLIKHMSTRVVLLTTISILILGLTSCDYEKKLIEAEKDLIASFIKNNGITVAPTASGLYYIETLLGDGPMVEDLDSVYIHYKTLLLSGQILDESTGGDPYGYIAGVYQVIEGFEEGAKLMRVGGKADLIIPSKLAYGKEGVGPIGSYTPLLVQIELVSIVPGPFYPFKK